MEEYSLLLTNIVNNEALLLHEAVTENRYAYVEDLLKSSNALINSRNEDGKTSIFLACEADVVDLNMIKLLFNYGADVNIAADDGMTCFLVACKIGHPELVEFLLNCSADPEVVDPATGYNCMHLVALNNSCTTLDTLMTHSKSKHIDLDIRDLDDVTPLMIAVDVDNVDIAQLFLKYGADCNAIGNDTSALHFAVCTRNKEMFDILYERVRFSVIYNLVEKNNLVKGMITHGWFFPHLVSSLLNVLDHPKIKSILEREKIYMDFFYRLASVQNIDRIDVCGVVEKLVDTGTNVTFSDFRTVLLINNIDYKVKFGVLDLLIKSARYDVDQQQVLSFIMDMEPSLVPKILTYCLKHSHKDILGFALKPKSSRRWIFQNVSVMLRFSTPNFAQINELKNLLMTARFHQALLDHAPAGDYIFCDQLEYFLFMEKRVPRLLEIARDVTRTYLVKTCELPEDYFDLVQDLEVPEYIRGLLTGHSAIYPPYYQ